MSSPIRILLIEDSVEDAELLERALAQENLTASIRRICTLETFRTALLEEKWDLILSDYVLPGFTALDALKTLHQSTLDIPFLVVSGKIGEEVAVESLKAGAHDYLLKDRLGRLAVAIRRELKEGVLRQKRRAAENALRDSEQRYRRLVEASPEGMFIIAEEKIEYVNPAAVGLFAAASPVELVGKRAFDFIAPESQASFREQMLAALLGHEGSFFEHRIQKCDGTQVTVEAIGRSIPYHGVPAIQIICRDITLRKELDQRKEQVNRMDALARMAGGVAHDFNNLLTVIMGYSRLMRSSMENSNALAADLDKVIQSTERAFGLTRQLLALSRKQTLAPVPTTLNQVVLQSQSLLRELLGESITLEFSLAENPWTVRVDPSQMQQVILNLANHARESMPFGGRLRIQTTNKSISPDTQSQFVYLPPGEYTVLTLTDTGAGLPPETSSHIFEPFFKEQRPQKYGLSFGAIYGVIKQHGGHIACESEPSKGCSFSIHLPRYSTAPAGNSTTLPAPPPIPSKETILVVEDEDVLRELARTILQKHGYSVVTAANGHEALEVCQTMAAPIHLVFTDVVMPKMNGPELMKKLASLYPGLPVLFTSGYARGVVMEYGVGQDESTFLQKPYTTQQLIDRVRHSLSHVR